MGKAKPRVLRSILIAIGTSIAMGAAAYAIFLPRDFSDGMRKARRYVSANGRAERRKARLERRLAQDSRHPWAGRYRLNSGRDNQELAVDPGEYCFENGYDFYDDEADGWTRTECGAASFKDGELFFDDPPPALDKSLRLIAWGDRRYLVPPDRLGRFAQAVVWGQEPRGKGFGSFLLRVGDELRPAPGRPNLPAEAYAETKRGAWTPAESIRDGYDRAQRAVERERSHAR